MNTKFHTVKAETDEQLQEIADLATIIWHQHFISIISEEQIDYMIEKFQSFPALQQQLADGYEYYLVFDGEEFCGYCGVHPENGRLFLSKLYIKKEARGRHLATQTLNFLIHLCKERGLSSIWLTCNKHNDHTLDVYRHLGFKTVDTQVADIGHGFVMDDYIMEYFIIIDQHKHTI